jgi:hypothetical protein
VRRAATGIALAAALAATGDSAAEGARFYAGASAGVFEPLGFSDSYDAVYGETLVPLGAAFEARLGSRWFVGLSTELASADGERVALVPEPVPTGVATELELNPWHLTFGWIGGSDAGWSVRLGGGATLLSWKETSAAGDASGSDPGAHLSVAVRRALGSFRLGARALYSTVPDALDEGAGAGAAFGEDDLGGLSLAATAGWAF